MAETESIPHSTTESSLERRVEHLEALLTVALADSLKKLREDNGVGDELTAQILRSTTDWSGAGEIKERVARALKAGDSTIRERCGQLAEIGALETRGKTKTREYRNTFLLG